MHPILHTERLVKRFGDQEVLQGIDLTIACGEVVALIGPSGGGKSTLLRCLNYLEKPTAGQVWFRNELLGQREEGGRLVPLPEAELDRQRARIGMVFQRLNLFPHLTALENVIEAPLVVKRVPRMHAVERGMELLERVGLAERVNQYPTELSGGQQQRVAIARALAMEPEVLLLDEITSALDPELVREILEVVKDLARRGMTLVMVTHEMRFAREVASRVIFLDRRILEEAAPTVFFDSPRHPRVQEFLQRML